MQNADTRTDKILKNKISLNLIFFFKSFKTMYIVHVYLTKHRFVILKYVQYLKYGDLNWHMLSKPPIVSFF